MKKIFLLAIVVLAAGCAMTLSAQDPDIAAIAQQHKAKSDSLSMLYGQLVGTRAAIDNPKSKARKALLKTVSDLLAVENKDKSYKDGHTLAMAFYGNYAALKKDKGIVASRKAFADAFLAAYSDTSAATNLNQRFQALNGDARRMMTELQAMLADSTAATAARTKLIALKSDSLSRNMGTFFGFQAGSLVKRQNYSAEQCNQLLQGFKAGMAFDEKNDAVLSGIMVVNEFLQTRESVKRHVDLTYSPEVFLKSFAAVLNDKKTPTEEQYKAMEKSFKDYAGDAESWARENSPEALTHRTMGKKYIERIMERDPGYIQTPSGLVYKVLAPGSGEQFKMDDMILVKYKGTHVDGTTFDESKEPVAFAPGRVVAGFREALLMMRPGAKMIAVMPSNLAYGDRGAGDVIKPYETLIFEIETIGLEQKEGKTPAEK